MPALAPLKTESVEQKPTWWVSPIAMFLVASLLLGGAAGTCWLSFLLTGIPKEILVNYAEIAHCLDKSIVKIETAVLNALEMTPPELSADIYRTGIYLAGGGALLRGLDKRLHLKTKLVVHIAEDPLKAVARGTAIALKNFDKFPFLIK